MNVKKFPSALFFIWFFFSFGPTLSGLAIILGRYQCVAASSDQLLR